MIDDPRTEPLKEWNRLARENTENAIVASMCGATLESSKPIEEFSTWLLIGAAGIASFILTNSDKLEPLMGKNGVAKSGAFLCASCVLGLLSKFYSLKCTIGITSAAAVDKTFKEHLEKYEVEEKKIEEGAKFWGITLETGVSLERILEQYFSTLPRIHTWYAKRQINKIKNHPQIRYVLPLNFCNYSGR